jgi:predicted RNA binding protein YcfA (HicA-like mRNA interferase family)
VLLAGILGRRKYPPLKPDEVVAILRALGFEFKCKEGSHEQYERLPVRGHPRRIATVDAHYAEFDDDLMKSMIRQSGHTREEFYGATKRTARKAGVPAFSMK